MKLFITNISKIYGLIVLKMPVYLIISFVLVYSYFLPLFNIIKILFHIKIHLYYLLGFFSIFMFLYILLKHNSIFYNLTRDFLFCDFFYKYKEILSQSRIWMNKYPKLFCLYIFISSHFSFLFYKNSQDMWLYSIYIILLIYRSIFIYPITGYVFIVNANLKKYEILKDISLKQIEKNVLFTDFYFLNNIFLKTNFECWIIWIEKIKLSQESVNIISKYCFLIFFYWVIFYIYPFLL